MRVKICGYLTAGIVLFCCQAGTADDAIEIEAIIRNQQALTAKADLSYKRAVDKARQDAILQLTKLAKKAYTAKNRQGETEAWRAILKIDANHEKAREYFTDLGSLDKELAAAKPKEQSVPVAAAPIKPVLKPAEAKPAVGQPVATKPAAPPVNTGKPANLNAKVAAEKNLEEVRTKLMELNPGFKGQVKAEFSIADGKLFTLGFSIAKVSNIEPLRDLDSVEVLRLENPSKELSPLSDLSPLSALPMGFLVIEKAQITDLRPLADTRLGALMCTGCPIADLSPLKGKLLKILDISETQVKDLTPIQEAKLKSFHCDKTRVADLSPLKGMPLETVTCNDSDVTDLSPLAGRTKLSTLAIVNCAVVDLSPIQGLPIEHLKLTGTKVTDLSPLKGAPLRILYCANTNVTNLAPVEKTPLQWLFYDFKNTADLKIAKSIESLELVNSERRERFFNE